MFLTSHTLTIAAAANRTAAPSTRISRERRNRLEGVENAKRIEEW